MTDKLEMEIQQAVETIYQQYHCLGMSYFDHAQMAKIRPVYRTAIERGIRAGIEIASRPVARAIDGPWGIKDGANL